jgi:hypothetical protein
MISKITNRLTYLFKTSNLFADILQTADNVIMFSLPGKEDRYKITITRIKNPVN